MIDARLPRMIMISADRTVCTSMKSSVPFLDKVFNTACAQSFRWFVTLVDTDNLAAGTLSYMAPEVISAVKNPHALGANSKVDIYR